VGVRAQAAGNADVIRDGPSVACLGSSRVFGGEFGIWAEGIVGSGLLTGRGSMM